MKRLSIRWRLTLWYASALAVILIGFCVVLLLMVRQQLMSRTDASLHEEIQELSLEIQLAQTHEEFTNRLHVRFFRHDTNEFVATDEQGKVVFSSAGLLPDQVKSLIPPVAIPAHADSHVQFFSRDLDASHPYRVALTVAAGPGGRVLIQTLTPLKPLYDDLQMLVLIMAVLVPIGILLALSGGAFLATRALAPVEQIVNVAAGITISELDKRVEVANPHDELGRLALTLNSLIAGLEKAVDEIQRFTADASHELRTPLAVLRSAAESALRKPRSTAEYEQTLQVIVGEATRLGRLTDQLLHLSRHDAGLAECRQESVPLDAVLSDVVDQLRPMARARDVSLELAELQSCDVKGDDIRLSQACFNVIENAIKYTPAGGTVSVECTIRQAMSTIRICDTGIGIAAEQLPRVFDRFYRVDASRSSGGAGLGLSIARTAVQAHGGEINIESQAGQGTTVTIELPATARSSSSVPFATQVAAPICLILSTFLVGCDQAHPATAKKANSPAKTTHPVAESQLNTIELTADAIRRLDLQTAVIEERTMSRSRSYGADLVLPTGASVLISAPLAGTLKTSTETSHFRVGQRVEEGKSLINLLPLLSPERGVLTPAERIRFAEAKNALAQSRIDAEGLVQQASVQVDAAKIALERAERLLREQAGTVRAVDEARAQLQLAEKAHAAAASRKRQVDAVHLDEEAGTLEPIAIPSPLSGILRSTQVRPGELVAAGAPLFEVMNDEILWVKVPVYVGELDEIDGTAKARLTLLNGRHSDRDLFVTPTDLPPTAVPLAAAVDIYYELPNPDGRYQPGQKVAARLVMKGDAQQVAVPWSAVIHDIYGGQWVYEKTGERHFVRRRVEIGWVDGDWAAITRGPRPGTIVVTAGAAEISGTEFGFAK